MRLLDLRLQNITCFDDITIDFRSEGSKKPAPWVVLLGENGTGKSTILQMIGAALLGDRQISVIAGDVDWSGYLSVGSDHDATVRMEIQPEPADTGFDTYLTQIPFSMDKPETYDGHRILGSAITMVRIADSGYSEPGSGLHVSLALRRLELTGGWFSCGYSPWRRLSARSNGDTSAFPTLDDSAKPFRFASLFDASGMTSVPKWFGDLYFNSIHPTHTEVDEHLYDLARETLKRAVPNVRSIRVERGPRVLVTEHGRDVPIDRLSDGYRGTLAWVGDLIRRLFDAYPESPNPLHESGVVLVDEIDLHLHPKWQRTVVHDIRTLFPNLQFIVTTHSPFIAQDLLPKDRIVVLERSERTGTVSVRKGTGVLESWSADQILGSYFGLSSGTRGAQTQRKEARYQKLLESEVSGKLTDKTRAELDDLRLKMDRVPVGETASEQDVYRMATEMATQLRRKREERESRLGGRHNGNGASPSSDEPSA